MVKGAGGVLHKRTSSLLGQWMPSGGPLRAATTGPTERESAVVCRKLTWGGPLVARMQSASSDENTVVNQQRVLPVV